MKMNRNDVAKIANVSHGVSRSPMCLVCWVEMGPGVTTGISHTALLVNMKSVFAGGQAAKDTRDLNKYNTHSTTRENLR